MQSYRKTIQGSLLLWPVIGSSMYTWESMYLEGTHMVVDSGMYVIYDIQIFFTVLAIYVYNRQILSG